MAVPAPQAVGNAAAAMTPTSTAAGDGAAAANQQNAAVPWPAAATQLAGFQHAASAPAEVVTPENLIEQGVPAIQANARVVRHHEEQLLVTHFRCWIILFSLIVCLATPTMVGLLIWLIVANLENRDVECEVPLQTWVRVVFCIVFFNSTINRPTPTGSCVQRIFCQWTRDPENPQPMPLRVWVYNLVFILFTFAWNCAGLHWVTVDGRDSTAQAPPCRTSAPTLYMAVKVYASFNLAVMLFMYVNMFGFAQLLRLALHRGYLRTQGGAPSGSLESNTEAMAFDDPAVAENPSCSICLEDFNADHPILRTKTCQHLFHRQCLKGWLQVSRTCPICRQDLGKAPAAWE